MRIILLVASLSLAEQLPSPVRPGVTAQTALVRWQSAALQSSVTPQPAADQSLGLGSECAGSSGGPFLTTPGSPPDDEERKRQQEFRCNVGKVIDTVQADYPLIFEACPDFSVYEVNVELTDPSGVSLRGLQVYKNCFSLLRLMRRTMAAAEVKCKVCYAGWDPYKVRVRWNVAFSTVLDPSRTYFIDGISVYTLSERGLVKRHDLQNVIVNGREVRQPYLSLLGPLDARGSVAAVLGGRFGVPGVQALPSLYQTTASEATDAEGNDSKERTKPSAPQPLFPDKGTFEVCETSYDCRYPLFCCDLLFAKICCSNGAFAPIPQPVPIPIPVPVDDPRGF